MTAYLQVRIDEDARHGRWILTGSENFALVESVSQSLAGRSAMLNLLPLTWPEITRFEAPPSSLDQALLVGAYPRVFDRNIPAAEWFSAYIAGYVERDVRRLANIGDLSAFQQFLALCAGRTSQLLNYSSLAADCGITQPTAKAWFSVLEDSFIAFRLPAWSGNVRKRLIKMPKLHFYDAGLVCWLLGIREIKQLQTHPLRGAVFETWVIAEVAKHRANAGQRGGMYFYRDHNGTEADLLIDGADGLTIVEAKAGQTITRNMLSPARRIAETLGSRTTGTPWIVHGGDALQQRSDCTVLPWQQAFKVTN